MVSTTLSAEPAHVAVPVAPVSVPVSVVLPVFHLPLTSSMAVMVAFSAAMVSVPPYKRRRGLLLQMRLAVEAVDVETVSVMPSLAMDVVGAVKSPAVDVVEDVPVMVGKMVA